VPATYRLLAHRTENDIGVHKVTCRIKEQPAVLNYQRSTKIQPELTTLFAAVDQQAPSIFPRMLQDAVVPWQMKWKISKDVILVISSHSAAQLALVWYLTDRDRKVS
jgi:hypothetical protein